MAWSYWADMLDEKDQVRFLIQDTVTISGVTDRFGLPSGILQDEEIRWLLTQEANIWMAAARALETAATNVLQLQTRSTSAVHVSYLQPSQVRLRADYLRQRGRTYQTVTAGGISLTDKQRLGLDSDWPPPPIALGQMDNRYAAPANPLVDPSSPVIPGG